MFHLRGKLDKYVKKGWAQSRQKMTETGQRAAKKWAAENSAQPYHHPYYEASSALSAVETVIHDLASKSTPHAAVLSPNESSWVHH